MAGLTTILLMCLDNGGVRGSGRNMAVETDFHRRHGVGMAMVAEIETAMAVGAVSATIVATWATRWHGCGGTIRPLQGAVGIMAGGAGIMNLVVSRIDRDTGASSGNSGMTRGAGRACCDQSCMIAAMTCHAVTTRAITARGTRRIMMNSARRVACRTVTVYAGAGQSRSTHCRTVNSCLARVVTSPGTDMAEVTVAAMHLSHHRLRNKAMTIGTVPRPAKIET